MIDDKTTAILLEEKGINMEEVDNEGKAALDIAEMNDQMEMMNYIKGKLYFKQTDVRCSSSLHSRDSFVLCYLSSASKAHSKSYSCND